MAIEIPEINQTLVVPDAISHYPTLGTAYRCGEYTVTHSLRLARTGTNYYDSKKMLEEFETEGLRMSTAAEELAIQLAVEREGKNPREAKVFADIFFGRTSCRNYVWQLTDTFLRVPKGKANPEKPDYIDGQGRKYWAREVGIGNNIVGLVLVPEGDGGVVTEWDEVFGIPRVTSADNLYPHRPHTTHSWFEPNPEKDEISGHYDVAVERWTGWHHDDLPCMLIDAGFVRQSRDSGASFRPVRGEIPEILKEAA